MDFHQFLTNAKKANPPLTKGDKTNVATTVENVTTLLKAAYDAGLQEGFAVGKSIKPDNRSVFEKLFGPAAKR